MRCEWSRFYLRVKPTGDIVQMANVPQQDPVIVQYGDGVRDVFRIKDLERVPKQALTPSPATHGGRRVSRVPGEIKLETLERQLKLLEYMREAKEPVKAGDATADLGFPCLYLMRRQRDKDRVKSLEELGIIEYTLYGRHWFQWHITELGRTAQAEELIRSQRADGGYVDGADVGMVGVPILSS